MSETEDEISIREVVSADEGSGDLSQSMRCRLLWAEVLALLIADAISEKHSLSRDDANEALWTDFSEDDPPVCSIQWICGVLNISDRLEDIRKFVLGADGADYERLKARIFSSREKRTVRAKAAAKRAA